MNLHSIPSFSPSSHLFNEQTVAIQCRYWKVFREPLVLLKQFAHQCLTCACKLVLTMFSRVAHFAIPMFFLELGPWHL